MNTPPLDPDNERGELKFVAFTFVTATAFVVGCCVLFGVLGLAG